MTPSKYSYVPIAFVVNFFAVGIPYWLIPYNKISLPDGLVHWGLTLVGISAWYFCASKVRSFWRAVRIAGSAVPAAVLARVIVDGVQDPTSHNLWPLEISIALVVGFLCALLGAAVGSLCKLFARDDLAAKS